MGIITQSFSIVGSINLFAYAVCLYTILPVCIALSPKPELDKKSQEKSYD
jgi:hypothetical protein